MKYLFLTGVIFITSLAAQAAGPTCAEYYKYKAQNTDWPYALPMSDYAENCELPLGWDKKWPPMEKECPQSQELFAIVAEHSKGTNDTFYCKVNIIEKYQDSSIIATRTIDCTNAPIEVDSLILIKDDYFKVPDKMGNTRCVRKSSLIKVIGKVPNQ